MMTTIQDGRLGHLAARIRTMIRLEVLAVVLTLAAAIVAIAAHGVTIARLVAQVVQVAIVALTVVLAVHSVTKGSAYEVNYNR
ncbi:hypothetical protein BC01_068 [Bacillus phage BC01]|nr:hypothetical protein BC01_068 [Bacillus phage BC01]